MHCVCYSAYCTHMYLCCSATLCLEQRKARRSGAQQTSPTATAHLCVDLLELFNTVAKGHNLAWAHESEVCWVEEEDDILACILQHRL